MGKTGAALWFEVEIDRNRAGRFNLRSARAIQPGKRQVIGSIRQASGELLEVVVTLPSLDPLGPEPLRRSVRAVLAAVVATLGG